MRQTVNACIVFLSLLICLQSPGIARASSEVAAEPPASNGQLKAQLEQLAEKSRKKLPQDVQEIIERQLDDLRKTKLAEHALRERDRVPLFSLPNATRQVVRLKDLLRKGPVVIAFYRGAWCPFCNLQLHALEQSLPQIKEAGATLVAISPQLPDASLSLVEKDQLTFEVLSDVGNKVARRFGIAYKLLPEFAEWYRSKGNDLKKFNGDESNELPLAATYVVGRDGTIITSFIDVDYRRRMEPSDIVAALNRMRGSKDRAGPQ